MYFIHISLHSVPSITFSHQFMPFSQKNILFPLFFILGFLSAVLLFGYSSWASSSFVDKNQTTTTTGSISKEVFTSKKIQEAQSLIQKEYYHFSEKTKDDIENGVITSLVWSLGDKHSSYFTIKQAKDFSEVLRGDFDGIGALIDEDLKGILIRKVFADSPAEKSWLKAGDILTFVGWESMRWLSTEEAVKKIRGPKWSNVVVKYIRGESDIESEIQITRWTVLIPSSEGKMLTGSIGYIEVASFWEHTKEEFQKSLIDLTASGAQGLIIDFRNNGGWYLDTAVDILSFLLPEKSPAVITRENDPKKTETLLTIKNPYTNTSIPVVMLVNELSASATEITAWALQDYGRALIVWQKTYGKWSVQQPFTLSDGSILKITIGRWYTPKDRWIDGIGITPDILIPLLSKDFEKSYDRQFEWARRIMEILLKNENSVEKTKEAVKAIDFTK